jgi:hypothetical protein
LGASKAEFNVFSKHAEPIVNASFDAAAEIRTTHLLSAILERFSGRAFHGIPSYAAGIRSVPAELVYAIDLTLKIYL